MRVTRLVALLVVLGVAAAGCARSAPRWVVAPSGAASASAVGEAGLSVAPVAHFAAKVPGGDLTAAIAVVGGKITAYVCDCRTADAWLNGDLPPAARGGTGSATGSGTGQVQEAKLRTATAALDVAISGTSAIGTVTWRGRTYPITLPAMELNFGLFKAKRGALSGGWIRLPGGGPSGSSCGIVWASGKPVKAGPFTGAGPVDIPGHGSLTPVRIGT
jgi:hypothetical protein